MNKVRSALYAVKVAKEITDFVNMAKKGWAPVAYMGFNTLKEQVARDTIEKGLNEEVYKGFFVGKTLDDYIE